MMLGRGDLNQVDQSEANIQPGATNVVLGRRVMLST